MKLARPMLWLVLVIALGSGALAHMDWMRDVTQARADALRAGDRLLGLLAMYPLDTVDEAARKLLVKSVVEQASGGVLYLLVQDGEGQPLVTFGDLSLRVPIDVVRSSLAAAGSLMQRFPGADKRGEVIELARPLVRMGGAGGTLRLGLRVQPPPFFSAMRLSSLASAAFLMVAALVVGYYLMLLAVRQMGRLASQRMAGGDALAAPAARGDGVFLAIEVLDRNLAASQAALKQSESRLGDESARLGVMQFELRQLHRVLDSLDFGILIVDTEGRIGLVNRALLGLLGAAREEVQGHQVADCIRHADTLALLERRLADAGSDRTSVETEFKEGCPGRHFRLACRVLQDASGDHIGLLLTAEDITRAKLAERAQDEFIAQVAHELLTPLTSLKTYSEMLMSGDVTDETMRREFYNTINGETDRLTGLIKNLLSAAKMELGTLTIQRAIVKTDWLMEQSLPAIASSAREKNIRIEQRLPDQFPTVVGDKDLLKVALVNLLGNAVKYTPPGGSVRVAVAAQDHSVLFEVADTGCGIEAGELPHIFEKFYRGSSAAVRAQSGSGLGLDTAMQIAKLHRGAITVESTPGKGSCFTLRVPTEEFSLEKRY